VKRDIASVILDKLNAIEGRLTKLESVAHPQSVMADPELTKAIRQIFNDQESSLKERFERAAVRPRLCRDPSTIRFC
jgi:hypothetical protein